MTTIKALDKLRKLTICDKGEKYTAYLDAGNIADEIEAETEEMKAFCERVEKAAKANEELEVFGKAYMPLPLDADGVPIRIGDVMERTAQLGESRKVNVLKQDEHGAWWYGTYAVDMYAVEGSVHHKQRTLEDVLSDFAVTLTKTSDKTNGVAKAVDECAREIRELLGVDDA